MEDLYSLPLLSIILNQPRIYRKIIFFIITNGRNIKEINESFNSLGLIVVRINALGYLDKVNLLSKKYLNDIINKLGTKISISRMYNDINIGEVDNDLINYLKESNNYKSFQFQEEEKMIYNLLGGKKIRISNLCYMKVKDKDDLKKVLIKFLSGLSCKFKIKVSVKIYRELNILGDFIDYESFIVEKKRRGRSYPIS